MVVAEGTTIVGVGAWGQELRQGRFGVVRRQRLRRWEVRARILLRVYFSRIEKLFVNECKIYCICWYMPKHGMRSTC